MTAPTADDVKVLVREAPADCAPFLATANVITTNYLTGKGIQPDVLDQITLYLAAHFVVLSQERGGLTRSRMGESDEYYRQLDSKAFGFSSTRFGQQAIAFDSSRVLSNISVGGLRAEFSVIKTRQDLMRSRIAQVGGWWFW